MKIINTVSIIATLFFTIQTICSAYDDDNLDRVDYSWKNPIMEIRAINKRNLDEGGAAYQYELIYKNHKNLKYVLDASSCYYPPFFCKSENKYLVSTYKIGRNIQIPCICKLKEKTYLDFYPEIEINDIWQAQEELAKHAITQSFGGLKTPDLYRDIKYVEDYLAIKKISENVDHVYVGISYDVDEVDSKTQFYYIIFQWEYTFDQVGETLNRVLKSAVVAYRRVESIEYDFSNEKLLSILKIIDNNRVTPLLKNINYSNMDPVLFVDEIKENNYHIGIINSDNTRISVKNVYSDAAPRLLSYCINEELYYVTTTSGEIEHLNLIDSHRGKLNKNIAFYSEDSFGYDFSKLDLEAKSLIKNSNKHLKNIDITREKVRIFIGEFPNIKESKSIEEFYDVTTNKGCFVYRIYYRINQGNLSHEIIIDFYMNIGFSKKTNKPKMFLLKIDKLSAPTLD